jgi:hypothetical protein
VGHLITGSRVALLVVLALIVFAAGRSGYGQGQSTISQSVQCQPQPFQGALAFEVHAGEAVSSGTFKVPSRTALTIEQIGLRVDALDFIAPAVAAVTTTVRSITAAYYIPIPADQSLVIPPRPLTLMQAGPLHADGGTTVILSISIDSRYLSGTGRAEWSISGTSCVGLSQS